MKQLSISEQIESIMQTLQAPITEEESSVGWSVPSKEAAHIYFIGLHAALDSGNPLPPLGIVRGLDHWGVVGGDLLESIAKATNQLRSSHEIR